MTKTTCALILALFLSLSSFATAAERGTDPFLAIEHIQLENGLQVFLAPSNEATLTSIRLNVGVGWDAEDASNWGVSHLLEHVLFRDKQLKDEMTYLQLIREAGGEANGGTRARVTSYFGSIPAQKGAWLLENIGKMILEPSIVDEYVEKEKGTVELEIGRPGPVTQALGFNPMDYFYPKYLKGESFWESEFNVSYSQPFTESQEQLSNQKLTASQLKTHYESYYHPSNMKLFVAGKFDRPAIMKLINEKWGSLPKTAGLTMPPEQKATPREAPYRRTTVSEATPYIYIGTKVWDTSLRDQQVIQSYLDYLSHRLMKEIRNIKGQTYSANSWTEISRGYGYAGVQFQTPKENFEENITYVKKYLHEEAQAGALASERIKEAIDLYLSQYQLSGREAQSMMNYAVQYDTILSEYGKFTSPYEALNSITPEEYTNALKRHFKPNQSYEYIYQPAFFFAYDYFLLYFAVAIFAFMGLRRLLTKSFENDQIRWIRKIQYPPVKMLETLALTLGWFVLTHLQYAITWTFYKSDMLQSHILLSQYLYSIFWVLSILIVAQGVFSLMPRKLMVVGDHLMVKSLSYFSRKIPLAEIGSVEIRSLISYPLPIFKSNFRFFFVNPKLWQKGLMITLKNGKSYYFSISAPDKACAELSRIVQSNSAAGKSLAKAA